MVVKDGFKFKFYPERCKECKGRCCRGETRSYLWVTENEIKLLSEYLNMDISEFKKNCLYSLNNRWSIKDCNINGMYECLFLNSETLRCTVYMVRPNQCRTYPFWDRFKEYPEELFSECIAAEYR